MRQLGQQQNIYLLLTSKIEISFVFLFRRSYLHRYFETDNRHHAFKL